ncbi:hypothetical protein NO932_14860 [Pelagibacterium sp. 26DY04]|uniref:hypothetical protein n=1 Tax=Pelagibacterium sp. 26DY04 TaxID=2967130 RepID=UPI0028168203|nr:hypothetical protein [Pelagibacterium sp. 26DY04]WMT86188.1 hypothetical protein NO932_14860 [Pelagibacterium sp. 26DY04]
MAKMTRRALIGAGGVLLAGAAIYGTGLVGCRFVDRNVPDFFAAVDPLEGVDPEILRTVGIAVVAAYPRYSLPEYAHAKLAGKTHTAAAMQSTCPVERLARFQAQCCQDFDDDKFVVVEGWIISETEAALCAHFVA